MIRNLLTAGILIVSLSGCAEIGARGISASLEALDAVKAYVDEKTDRREALRDELYKAEDQVVSCYQFSMMVEAGPESTDLDCSIFEERYERLAAFVDNNYPDLAQLVEDIKELKQAFQELRNQ